VFCGITKDVSFEIPLDSIEMIDKFEIGFDAPSDDGIGELFGDTLAIDFVGDLFTELGKVTLAVGVLDVAQEIGTLTHEVVTSSKKVTGSPHFGRIDVSLRDHAGTQEGSDFTGIDFVIFDFGAVDGLHVKGVTEDEGDVFFSTEVGKPVPGEHAFDSDNDVFSVCFDSLKEGIGLSVNILVKQDVPVLVEDTEIHGSGMKVDTAVEFMLLRVESHEASSLKNGYSSTEHIRKGMLRRRPQ
jgi:hypothetical protein